MDKLTRAKRSENMRRIVGKNTAPELLVRKIVASLGYRYRLHSKNLPGKPDLVFTRKKKAVFVHGCFWHMHTRAGCADARIPKSRVKYWTQKLRRNCERDKSNIIALRKMGWRVMTIWQCQVENSPAAVASRIDRFLRK